VAFGEKVQTDQPNESPKERSPFTDLGQLVPYALNLRARKGNMALVQPQYGTTLLTIKSSEIVLLCHTYFAVP